MLQLHVPAEAAVEPHLHDGAAAHRAHRAAQGSCHIHAAMHAVAAARGKKPPVAFRIMANDQPLGIDGCGNRLPIDERQLQRQCDRRAPQQQSYSKGYLTGQLKSTVTGRHGTCARVWGLAATTSDSPYTLAAASVIASGMVGWAVIVLASCLAVRP